MTFVVFTDKLKILRPPLFISRKRIRILLIFALFTLFLSTRLYNFPNRLGFDHDQEKAAEAAWNLLVEHKLSLIGIETSTGGLFAGPLLYWTNAIFLYVYKLDPIALGYQAIMFSSVAVFILFTLVKEISNTKTALLASFTYIISARLTSYDISASPISYITLLSTFVIYLTYKVSYLKKYYLLPLLTFALSLGYHVHFTLLLQIPAVIIIFILRRPRLTILQFITAILTFLLPLSTYFIFEIRHNFIMSKNILSLLAINNQTYGISIINTIINFFAAEAETIIPVKFSILFILLLVIVVFRTGTHLNKTFFKESILFFVTPLLCLFLYKQHIPEYYFLVATPAALILISNLYYDLFKKAPLLIVLFLLFSVVANFQSSIFFLNNPFSINVKKTIVKYIKDDSRGQNINLNYEIPTSQSYGFEYLFKWAKVTVNNTSESIYVINYSSPQEFNPEKYEKEGRTLETRSFEPFYVVSIK